VHREAVLKHFFFAQGCLPKLHTLTLFKCHSLETISSISALKSLTSLIINQCSTLVDIRALSSSGMHMISVELKLLTP
jgi:hypothetical protein